MLTTHVNNNASFFVEEVHNIRISYLKNVENLQKEQFE